jgi:hypothetical protein
MFVLRRSIIGNLVVIICGILLVKGQNGKAPASGLQLPLNLIKLPPGFKISMYYDAYVPGARSMTLSKGNNGNATIVYVGTRDKWSTVRRRASVT